MGQCFMAIKGSSVKLNDIYMNRVSNYKSSVNHTKTIKTGFIGNVYGVRINGNAGNSNAIYACTITTSIYDGDTLISSKSFTRGKYATIRFDFTYLEKHKFTNELIVKIWTNDENNFSNIILIGAFE